MPALMYMRGAPAVLSRCFGEKDRRLGDLGKFACRYSIMIQTKVTHSLPNQRLDDALISAFCKISRNIISFFEKQNLRIPVNVVVCPNAFDENLFEFHNIL